MRRLITLLLLVCSAAFGQTISFSDAGTFYTNGTVGTTHDCPLMATINAGDGLIILTGIRDTSSVSGLDITINTSDGWASLFESGSTDRGHFNIWWKIADGSEDGENVNFSGATSSADSTDSFFCRAYRFTISGGTFATTIYESVDVASGGDPPSTVPTVTPTGPNRLAVAFRMVEYRTAVNSMDSYESESGCDYTQATESAGPDSSNDMSVDMQTAALSGACSGASDDYNTNTPDSWRVVAFALVPNIAGGQRGRRPIEF